MTKADLLQALEPYTDDIQIVVVGRDSDPFAAMWEPAEIQYCIADADAAQCAPRVGITSGDGFLVLRHDNECHR